ncbi:MAG: isochorismatase family cysteine hydrolase [Trueperaceae bacterium]
MSSHGASKVSGELANSADRRGETALLMVDVINGFFDGRGDNYHPEYERLHEPLAALARAAHRAGKPVIHAVEHHRPGPDFEFAKHREHCIAGSWEAEPVSWLPAGSDDVIVRKRRYSAFFATDLDLLLRERGVDRIVVAGVKSNVCVRATIQDAFAYGYSVLLARQATASNRPHLHQAVLEDVQRYFGSVIGIDDALAALASSREDIPARQPVEN